MTSFNTHCNVATASLIRTVESITSETFIIGAMIATFGRDVAIRFVTGKSSKFETLMVERTMVEMITTKDALTILAQLDAVREYGKLHQNKTIV